MSSEHLSTFIRRHGVAAELVTLPDHAPTVLDAARVLGVMPEQIVKSVLVMAEDTPVLVIANGTDRIDVKLLAVPLGVSKRGIRLVDPQRVLALTGYEVGSVPPFGHTGALRTLVSARIFAFSEVYAGGGRSDRVLRVAPAEILRVTTAEVFGPSGPEHASPG